MIGLAKLAFASKAQKLFNAGKLSDEAAERLFQAEPIANNLHNRINARAQRGLFNQLPKGTMTAKKFEGVSQPDNLASRAPLDTKRVMKHQGHENSKIISELKEQATDGARVSRTKDYPFDGVSSMRWNDAGKPVEWNIGLPKKDAKLLPASYGAAPSNKAAKEARALTARHEIAGEATSQSRLVKALAQRGYGPRNGNIDLFRMNGHNTPDVLAGDAKMVKRLSPETQRLFDMKNKHNVTDWSNPNVNFGHDMNEGQLMNVLRRDGARVSQEDSFDVTNTPFFKKPLLKSNELHETLTNMGTLNNGRNHRELLSDIATDYMNTPFYTKNK